MLIIDIYFGILSLKGWFVCHWGAMVLKSSGTNAVDSKTEDGIYRCSNLLKQYKFIYTQSKKSILLSGYTVCARMFKYTV